MLKFSIKTAMKFSLLLVGLFLTINTQGLLVANIAYAQEQKKTYKTRRTPTIREQVYKRLAEVQEKIDEKDLVKAQEILLKMVERGRSHNSYEQASVYNMLAYIAYSNDDYPQAIEYYEQVVVDRQGIPEGVEQATLYTLGQLHFVQEDYKKSIIYLQKWFDVAPDPGPNPYVFLAQTYYQLRQFYRAIPVVEKAIEIARTRGASIKENWWLLLRSMYFEREDYDKVIEILEILARDFSKREYWVQLSGLYGQEGSGKRQIQAIDVGYIGNLLEREREILNLVGLLMQSEVTYRAAVILEKAIADEIVEPTSKNLKMLAQAWQISQEIDKAIPVLKEAADKADKGDLHLYLAQVYLEKEQYDSCIGAIEGALQKGDLKRESLAWEVQGMCRFNNQSLEDAGSSFREAKRLAKDKRDLPAEHRIDQWIRYIKQEQKRLEALGKS